MKKRFMTIILALSVLVSMLSLPAFADDANVYTCPYCNCLVQHFAKTVLGITKDSYWCPQCGREYKKTSAGDFVISSDGNSQLLNNALSATTQAVSDNTLTPVVSSSGAILFNMQHVVSGAKSALDSFSDNMPTLNPQLLAFYAVMQGLFPGVAFFWSIVFMGILFSVVLVLVRFGWRFGG